MRKIKQIPFSVLLMCAGVLLLYTLAQSAPVIFTQTTWTTANSASTADLPAASWSEYTSKDLGVAAGADIQLQSVNFTLTQTSNDGVTDSCNAPGCATGGGFNAGTFTNTMVSGTGEPASVQLQSGPAFTDWSQRFVASYSTAGVAKDIFIVNNTVYIADQATGLNIVDISVPSNPNLLGSFATAGPATGVAVRGNYAYVAVGAAGLQIVNISAPGSMSQAGIIDTPGTAHDVALLGTNQVVVADESQGMRIIDVTNPASPVPMGFVDTPGIAVGVFVAGNKVYVADRASGLRIIDVTNLTAPVEIGFYMSAGEVWGVHVDSNKAYIAQDVAGLRILDVTVPTSISVVGMHDTFGNAYGIAFSSPYVFVADNTYGLSIYDVSTAAAPRLVGVYDTPGTAFNAAFNAGRVYVADGSSGMQVIDASTPIKYPSVSGAYVGGGSNFLDVAVRDTFAYLANSSNGLKILDISTPGLPSPLSGGGGTLNGIGNINSIAIESSRAYVTGGSSGFKVIDIGFPVTPSLLTQRSVPGFSQDIAVAGGIVYVAAGLEGLRVYSASTAAPVTITALGYFKVTSPTAGDAKGVTVVGNYAYVGFGSAGLYIIDVSDPALLVPRGNYDTAGDARAVEIAGNFAYVADGPAGMQIIDISNPMSPVPKGVYDTPGNAFDVAVQGMYAYVADDMAGVQVVNISDPMNPKLAATIRTAGSALNIALQGAYAYAATGTGGLEAARITEFTATGTYGSPVMDLGAPQNIGKVSWLPLDIAGDQIPAISVQLQAGSTAASDCPGACLNWTNWTSVTNNTDTGAVFDGKRYVRYSAVFPGSGNNAQSPQLDSLSLDFSGFPISGGLTSSVFDTGDDNNYLTGISWGETLGAYDVRLQVATSGDGSAWNYCGSASCSTSGWLDFAVPANYYTNAASDLPHLESRDVLNDRYFKYKVWLVSNGSGTPTLHDVSIQYDSAHLEVFGPGGASSSYVATAGVPFDIVIKVKDSSGALLISHDSLSTVKLTASSAQPDKGGCASSFTGNANTELVVTGQEFGADGTVTVSGVTLCDASVAGFTVSAQVTSGSALFSTSNLTVTDVAPHAASLQIAYATQPAAVAEVSVDLDPPPVVHILDQYGNIDDINTTGIALSAYSDSVCSSTPATGVFNATALGTAAGVATFSGVNYDKPEKIYIKASGGSFSPVCSNEVVISSAGIVVNIDPIYNATNDAIIVSTSLIKSGALVTDIGNMTLTEFKINNSAGVLLSVDSLTTVTDSVNAVFHTTWDPATSLAADITYSIIAKITYKGEEYTGFQAFDIGHLGLLANDIQNIEGKVDNVQATVSVSASKAAAADTDVLALDTKVTGYEAKQAAFRSETLASLQSVNSSIQSILEDTSKTLPDKLKNEISNRLAKGIETEIVTTQWTVETGETLPFRFRTASGLKPVVTVYDPHETAVITNAVMKEIGGTGVYQYNITFGASWGLGQFMIRVDEPTKGSTDNLVLNVVEPKKVAGSAGGSAFGTSAVSLDTLYMRMNNMNTNMDTLLTNVDTVKENTTSVSADVDELIKTLEGAGPKETSGPIQSAGDLEMLNQRLGSVSKTIGVSGGTTNLDTIMGKLNGIEATLTGLGSDATEAMAFNENAKEQAAKIRDFIMLISSEMAEEGQVVDPEAKLKLLEEYLQELRDTVTGIPKSVTTDSIQETVRETIGALDEVTAGHENLSELMPLVKENMTVEEGSLEEKTQPQEGKMLEMRNDVNELKSIMVEIRGLLDQEVNKPVVHGWLEGN